MNSKMSVQKVHMHAPNHYCQYDPKHFCLTTCLMSLLTFGISLSNVSAGSSCLFLTSFPIIVRQNNSWKVSMRWYRIRVTPPLVPICFLCFTVPVHTNKQWNPACQKGTHSNIMIPCINWSMIPTTTTSVFLLKQMSRSLSAARRQWDISMTSTSLFYTRFEFFESFDNRELTSNSLKTVTS